MSVVTLQIPDEVEAKLGSEEFGAGGALRLAAAFSLCQRGKITVSQGARLAEMTYTRFLEAAAAGCVELFPTTVDEVAEECRSVRNPRVRLESLFDPREL